MELKSRILVCGGRKFANYSLFDNSMSIARQGFAKRFCIIQGGATGADKMAKDWANLSGIPCIGVEANWYFFNNGAGHIRNGWMLEWCTPDLIIAFPGGPGTTDMIKQGRAHDVYVWEPK